MEQKIFLVKSLGEHRLKTAETNLYTMNSDAQKEKEGMAANAMNP